MINHYSNILGVHAGEMLSLQSDLLFWHGERLPKLLSGALPLLGFALPWISDIGCAHLWLCNVALLRGILTYGMGLLVLPYANIEKDRSGFFNYLPHFALRHRCVILLVYCF